MNWIESISKAIDYIEKNLNNIISMIISGANSHSLDKIFIVQKFINNS